LQNGRPQELTMLIVMMMMMMSLEETGKSMYLNTPPEQAIAK